MNLQWIENDEITHILYDTFICNQISNIKSKKFYLKSKYL